LSGGENEDGAGDDDERGDEGGGKMSGGKSAGAGARVGGVEGGVGEAVEGHGGGAGGEHGDDDPEELMGGGKAGGGEHGAAESEGESEDGVLPLNHFERDAEIVKGGHGTIVEQVSAAGRRSHALPEIWIVNVVETNTRAAGETWRWS